MTLAERLAEYVRACFTGLWVQSSEHQDALAEVAGHVVTLAEAEDLPGHGTAVSVRFEQ